MEFRHDPDIWQEFPELAAGVIVARGVTPDANVDDVVARYQAIADERLATTEVGSFPEIQAWRRAFSRMGLKPTQYRCAAEALLRRYRKDGELPRIHPLVDACNAISLAFAIPIAVFDLAGISEGIVVRRATGEEVARAFSGETEHPDPGEVIFADAANRVHARRWCNRQTAASAIRPSTRDVLIVTEAMHDGGGGAITRITEALAGMLTQSWGMTPQMSLPDASSPRVTF